MENDPVYQYLKLALDYVPFWALLAAGFLVWTMRHPAWLEHLSRRVDSVEIGQLKMKLRQVEQNLQETKESLVQIEEENARLSALYSAYDPHAPVEELESTRQELKAVAGRIQDMSQVLQGLRRGADPADVYAAAEILRTRRDPATFPDLAAALDRIASSPELEGLRYHTVWTLASAAHRILISAIRHSPVPKLDSKQLEAGRAALEKLCANPHVQHDRPDDPMKGIRGPATHALKWIETGLQKHAAAD